jgi:hypothetical protein
MHSIQHTRKIPRPIFWLMLLISTLVGMYGSLKVVVGLSRIDPDSCHSIMLWHGVTDHGMSWLSAWIFTQDNWLFSLVPFHFLGFLIFGATPAVVIFGGWVIFILSAFVSGAIAWKLDAKRAALLIPVVLLFAGHFVHANSFASYSTSHNVTNLFGLASLLALLQWVHTRKNISLILLLLILIAGAVSDPWMVAAYNLPIMLVSAILCFIPTLKIKRMDCAKLFLVALVSILAVKTKLFRTLTFLPSMEFHVGSWDTIKNNFLFLIKNLGGMLDVLPFLESNDFVYAAISLLIIVSLLIANIVKAIRSNVINEKSIFIFALCSFFSIGGISLAYAIGSIEATSITARFLVNCMYLSVIGLGVLLDRQWEQSSTTIRIVSFSVITLFLLAGVTSNFQAWKAPGFAVKGGGTIELLDFLQKNNLSYGYGPYWGAHANAVTAASDSKVRIRPVVFDNTTGMMIAGTRPESSKHWYLPDDAPVDQKEYFVLVRRDVEECVDINLCIAGLEKQFGSPVKRLKYSDATILVWDHPLISYLAPPRRIALEDQVRFNALNPPLASVGWSAPEGWGTWSVGNKAFISLLLSNPPDYDTELLIDANAFLAKKHREFQVEVSVNQFKLGTLKYDEQSKSGVRILRIPKTVINKDGKILIRFDFKNPKSPAELGVSEDIRRLGLGLVAIQFRIGK